MTTAKRSAPGNELERSYTPPPLDEEVRNRILLEQMPQVRYIARHIHDRLPQHVPLEDLVHAGVLGLMDALTKYDDARQVQFKTYAKFRIRGAILDSLRELDWSPRDLRRKARMIESASSRLSQQFGRSPTEQEIAHEMGLTLESFQHLLGDLEGLDLGSFHVENSDAEHDDDLCEYLPGNPDESPYYLTMRSELRRLLIRAVEELDEKEQQVLSLYYYEELTMKEAGAVLGIGESRVSQIHSLALVRLRTSLQTMLAGTQMTPHLADQAVRTGLEDTWKRC
jgi:RNA polymerase sigma factor for flagellar operon FliA